MLLKFCVDNYLSFRGKSCLDFNAGSIKEYSDDNVFALPNNVDQRILKSLAIYGINSSGKTNLMKAFSFMKNFVLHSSKESQARETILVQPFTLNTGNENMASLFDAEFIIDGRKFRFGFKVNKNKILEEWLFVIDKKKEENLYLRVENEYQLSKKTRARMELVTGMTRPNALFLSVLAQFNDDLASKVVAWFKNCMVVFDANEEESIAYTASLLSEAKYNSLIHQILRQSDLGFTNVEQEIKDIAKKTSYPEGFISALNFDATKSYGVRTKHKKYNQDDKAVDTVFFDLKKNESVGTQRYFGLLGPIVHALIEQRVLWIDELDARLHTNLLYKILGLFNSRITNPNGAQLIFTSHNPLLLKKGLRRDQMIFVEKDLAEGSIVNSLYAKDSTVRNDASFDKDFLSGKYVQVPKVDTQLSLFDLF